MCTFASNYIKKKRNNKKGNENEKNHIGIDYACSYHSHSLCPGRDKV